jgi:hypothetical protein
MTRMDCAGDRDALYLHRPWDPLPPPLMAAAHCMPLDIALCLFWPWTFSVSKK